MPTSLGGGAEDWLDRAMEDARTDHTATRQPYGTLGSGESVDRITLSSPRLRVEAVTYGARIVSVSAPDPRASSARWRWDWPTWRRTRRTTATSAPASGATRTGSPADGSSWTTARSRSRPTNPPTARSPRCTAGDGASMPTVGGGGRAGAEVRMRRVSPDGEMGFPGDARRHRDLPRRGCRPRGGVRRHDNGPDGGQPDEPHVLQPGRRRLRRGPCGPDRGRRDPADRRAVDPHR